MSEQDAATNLFKQGAKSFLDNNILTVHLWKGKSTNFGHFKLVPSSDQGDRKGVPIGVYKLVAVDQPNSSCIPAFWCPYSDGKTCSTVLTDKANFMFTYNMDGCSFAKGIMAKDSSLWVAHSNADDSPYIDSILTTSFKASESGQMDLARELNQLMMKMQSDDQYKKLLDVGRTSQGGPGTQNMTVLHSRDHISAQSGAFLKITTVGVRDPETNVWKFYYQAREKVHTTWSLLGCLEF